MRATAPSRRAYHRWWTVFLAAVGLTLEARAEVLLGIGTVGQLSSADSEVTAATLILRNENGTWSRVLLAEDLSRMTPSGIVVAPGGTAWAYGVWDDLRPALLRSEDGGIGWQDASGSIPSSIGSERRIVAMAFSTAGDGALALVSVHGFGPEVLRTGDGGTTWEILPSVHTDYAGAYFLAPRRGEVELIQRDSSATTVEAQSRLGVENPSIAPNGWDAPSPFGRGLVAASSPGGAFLPPIGDPPVYLEETPGKFWPTAVSSTGDRTWIVGFFTSPTRRYGSPMVYVLDTDRDPQPQPVPVFEEGMLQAVDFLDRNRGLAAGVTAGARERPFVLATDDGGRSWMRSDLCRTT